MTRYEWTDWITHIPGQELPVGLHVRVEFHGYWRNGGTPYVREATIMSKHRGHGSWSAETPGDKNYCMIRRYQIRAAFDEDVSSVELEVA